ncbi:MAG TPA: hypothetical protein VE258_13380 [Ktedonobacterales bacterium]|nr:hypothetical protein [Ktedonobacterales bacterium]
MPLLIAALLGLSGLLIVLYPLLGLDRAPAAGAPRDARDEAERERLAKQALRDVDFDYRLGNLDEGDYQELRQRYEERALLALRARYERERTLDAAIDEQLAALRRKKHERPASRSQPAPQMAAATGHETAATRDGRAAQNGHKAPPSAGRPRRRKGV